jgi:hypothetical protein
MLNMLSKFNNQLDPADLTGKSAAEQPTGRSRVLGIGAAGP